VYISSAVLVVNPVGQTYSTPEHQGHISTIYIKATAGLKKDCLHLCLEFHTPNLCLSEEPYYLRRTRNSSLHIIL